MGLIRVISGRKIAVEETDLNSGVFEAKMGDSLNLEMRLKAAIRHFWTVRGSQAASQGGDDAEARDRGGRGAVTGGKQMDGFVRQVQELLLEAGLDGSMMYCRPGGARGTERAIRNRYAKDGPRSTDTRIPGWFRAEKDLDLLIIVNGNLLAAVEFKSQVGSFGNNFNNRTEEALGNAIDVKAAYREGAFKPSLRPWLGFLMLLEDAPKSTRPVRAAEPHFKVFDEFREASYAQRYDVLLTKLVREELYDSACFLLSPETGGLDGASREPNPELSFKNFIASLVGHASAIARMHPVPADSVQPETLAETRTSES